MSENERFLVAKFGQFEIYLLNPGDVMQGFGGSRHGLLVRKTASLVVRYIDNLSGTVSDTEYDVNNQRVWAAIFRNAARAEYFPEQKEEKPQTLRGGNIAQK